mmetsp:Transcript_15101/g.30680  ORF Transcript_15101/g.30680 Transcript_15101/m.30680 type:complete len:157 (-) Transcript_15101:406-876(-)
MVPTCRPRGITMSPTPIPLGRFRHFVLVWCFCHVESSRCVVDMRHGRGRIEPKLSNHSCDMLRIKQEMRKKECNEPLREKVLCLIVSTHSIKCGLESILSSPPLLLAGVVCHRPSSRFVLLLRLLPIHLMTDGKKGPGGIVGMGSIQVTGVGVSWE